MSLVDIPLNPRLAHAVWLCTRTSGSPLEGQHLQVLQVQSTDDAGVMSSRNSDFHAIDVSYVVLSSQEFLLDSTTVDATYLTIVERARAQPVRLA